MSTVHEFPDLLGHLDGRLRKEIVQSRLFRSARCRVVGRRYRLLRRVGAGGTGVVYAARDDELGRVVALKLLHAGSTSAGRGRLRHEARILARLNHPNIVKVFGLAELDGHGLVVMELVEGSNLRGVMCESSSRPRAWTLAQAAGRGLAAAHAAGVVHGDFKPENVLVAAGDGAVKVVDFGVARVEADLTESTGGSDDEVTTIEGLTPAYAAPERLAGAPPDTKSDQYSLCVTLWEALTGTRPPAAGSPKPGTRVRRVLERGLQPAPEDRWGSVHALLDALDGSDRRRRWWIVIGGSATLATLPLWRPAETDPCAGPAPRIETVWDADRRSSIIESLQSVGVADALDDYARRYEQARLEACRTNTDPDIGGPAAVERRQWCLRTRLDAFDTLAGVVETASPIEAASAIGSLSSMGQPEACLHGADPRLSPEIESLLARSEVLEDIGRPTSALRLLEAATWAEPEALHVQMRRAQVLTTLDQPEEARASLQGVYVRARELGQERIAARAAIALVFNTSADSRHHHEAETWVRHASSLLERIEAEEGLALSLEHARATVLRGSGARIAAMAAFDELEPKVQRLYGRGAKPWAEVRHDRAGTYREAGRFERELELARDGYEAARGRLGDDHRLTLDLKLLLGGALVELQRADEAHTVLTQTRRAFEQIYGPEHEALQYVHADLADVADLEGDLEGARAHYDAAFAILDQRGESDGLAAVALINKRASVIWRLGDAQLATSEFHRAFDLSIVHRGVSSPRSIEILNDLLVHQTRAGQWEAAEATLERGRAWLQHVADPLSRALFMYNEASIMIARGDADEGIRTLEHAFTLAGSESSEIAVEGRKHLADFLWERDAGSDRGRAHALVEEAATIAHELGQDDASLRAWLADHRLCRGGRTRC